MDGPSRITSFTFLGTGTSSCVPAVGCLTSEQGCECCRSTLTDSIQGKRNTRRNTSGVLRLRSGKDGEMKTILIDCGKSFYQSALEWFPKLGLRKIDAVILTHAHADAMNGLDDLRGWTLGGFVQPVVDIYCDAKTLKEITRSFPYLVSAEFATGGGDLPEFRWHVFDELDTAGFWVEGIKITPLPVYHGRLFVPTQPGVVQPYPCLGFLFDNPPTPTNGSVKSLEVEGLHELAYISDCSSIPPETYARMGGRVKHLVIDCLKPTAHTSHFGLQEAITAAQLSLVPTGRSYWVGFAHRITHADWVTAGLLLRKARSTSSLSASAIRDALLQRVMPAAIEAAHGQGGLWAMPAYDGLSIPLASSTDRLVAPDEGYE